MSSSTPDPSPDCTPSEGDRERCCCCGQPAPLRDPDPWQGRMDAYCEGCAETRCDAYPGACRPPPSGEGETRRSPMPAVLQAMAATRDGMWVKGAPTHVLAEFLNELEARGWVVQPASLLAKARDERDEARARVQELADYIEAAEGGYGK